MNDSQTERLLTALETIACMMTGEGTMRSTESGASAVPSIVPAGPMVPQPVTKSDRNLPPAAVPAPPAAPPPPAAGMTAADLNAALMQELTRLGRREPIEAALAQYGATTVPGLAAENYDAVLAAIRAVA